MKNVLDPDLIAELNDLPRGTAPVGMGNMR